MRLTLPARSAVQAVTQFPPFQFLGRTAVVRRILGWRPSLRLDQSPGPLEAGIAAGVLAVCVSHPVLAVLGTSLPVTTGLLLAVALAVQLGWSSAAGLGSVSPETGEPQGLRDFASEFLLTGVAVFALALPWLAETAAGVIGRMSLPVLAQTGGALLLAYVGGSVLAGIPAMALAAAVGRAAGHQRDPQGGGVRVMAGFAAGLVLMAVLAGPLAGIQPVAAVLCLLLVVRLGLHSAAYSGFLPGWQTADETPTEAGISNNQYPAAAVNGAAPTVASRGWTLAATFWMGCVAAVLARGVFQLMPATFSVRIMFWAGLAGGCAAGWQLARRSRFRPLQAGVAACLLAGFWLAVLMACFPQAVQVQLWFNAHVSYAWLQLGLRAGMVWLTSLPVGVACGLLWAMVARKAAAAGRTADDLPADIRQVSGADAAGSLLPGCQALALLAGMCSVWWFGFRWLSAGSLAATLLPAGVILAGIAVLLQRVARGSSDAESLFAQQSGGTTTAGSRFPRFARYLAPGAMAFAVVVMLLGPVWQHRADPSLAAQLLFSTRVFLASRGDLPPAMLPHLDETRLVDQTEGDNGTLSLWSMRGVQLQLRDGGVPKSAVSRNPAVCPQFAAEVMQMALPLAMHESPHNVLLLGAGTGAGVHAGLAFPVKQLVCVEGDRGLHTLLNRSVWPKLHADPRQDDRLAMVSLDPALAVRTASGQYDVVISSPDQTSLHQSLAYSSPGFYRAAAAQLNQDGIFCQRVQHMDFGPEAVASLVRSVMSVFTDVAAVATAPGEWTLLATRSAKGLNREGLDDRLQKRHVRRVLAELGWDWTVPLNLQGFDQAGLEGFVQQQRSSGGLIRADRLAFALPVDVLRWSPKQQQLAAAAVKKTENDVDDLLESAAENVVKSTSGKTVDSITKEAKKDAA
ncbi:MAG: hypothetical protein KDA79_08135, partial [Planctomycetaceae bacterium]|nr:hypothetical protein [Planctomycetaceae bacterium]